MVWSSERPRVFKKKNLKFPFTVTIKWQILVIPFLKFTLAPLWGFERKTEKHIPVSALLEFTSPPSSFRNGSKKIKHRNNKTYSIQKTQKI